MSNVTTLISASLYMRPEIASAICKIIDAFLADDETNIKDLHEYFHKKIGGHSHIDYEIAEDLGLTEKEIEVVFQREQP